MALISFDTAKAQVLPVPKGVGLSLRAASYGIEIMRLLLLAPAGISVYRACCFGEILTTVHCRNLTQQELKHVISSCLINPQHYFGTLIGANGFEKKASGDETFNYTPVVGAGYGLEYILVDRWFGAELELQGGVSFEGKGYVGIGISLVFYRN